MGEAGARGEPSGRSDAEPDQSRRGQSGDEGVAVTSAVRSELWASGDRSDDRPDFGDQLPYRTGVDYHHTGDDAGDNQVAADREWAWVQEWRASGEPPAWAPGLALAGFTALIVGLAVLVLSTGLADIPWLAVSANVLVAAGLAPALWLSRHLPVLRWIAGGAAVGVVVGWIAALIT